MIDTFIYIKNIISCLTKVAVKWAKKELQDDKAYF